MTENYAALSAHASLTIDEIAQFAASAFNAAWLTARARDG